MSGTRGADELRMALILRSRGVGPDAEPQPQPDPVAAAAATLAPAAAPLQPQPGPAAEPDWWDALYPEADADSDRTGSADTGEEETQPSGRSRLRLRIPPWWTGRSVDLTPPEEEDPGADDVEDTDGSDDEPEGEEEDGDQAADTDDGAAEATQPPRSRTRKAKPKPRSRKPGQALAPRALVDSPPERRSLIDAYAAVPPRIRWLIYHGGAAAAGYRIGWVDYATRTAAWIAGHGYTDRSALFWYGVTTGCVLLYRRYSPRYLVLGWLATIPIASVTAGTLLYGSGWSDLHLEFPL